MSSRFTPRDAKIPAQRPHDETQTHLNPLQFTGNGGFFSCQGALPASQNGALDFYFGLGGPSSPATPCVSSSSATTSSSGGSSSSSSTSGGTMACQTMCEEQYPAGAAALEGPELQECGCYPAGPCDALCTAECADPTSLNSASPCGACLASQMEMIMQSSCTLGAVLQCEGTAACVQFANCLAQCP
jgi:hypothetical protein